MKVGYARVSTDDQSLELQTDALNAAGCTRLFTDKISGSKDSRPGLDAMLEFVRKGDQVVVWKLDRLGRSIKHLIELVHRLQEEGVELQVITGGIDTTSPAGKMIFHIFGAFAEFERDLIRERTRAGLNAARERGRAGGRPAKLSDKEALRMARLVSAEPERDLSAWCEDFGISRSTFYRHVKPLLGQQAEPSGVHNGRC